VKKCGLDYIENMRTGFKLICFKVTNQNLAGEPEEFHKIIRLDRASQDCVSHAITRLLMKLLKPMWSPTVTANFRRN